MFRSVSFHPKFAATLEAIFCIVMLWWLKNLGVWWVLFLWIFFRLALLAALARLVYYPPQLNRWHHFFSLLIFYAGVMSLLLFIEWPWAWYLTAMIFVFFPAFSFWLLPPQEVKLAFMSKSHRSWRFIMSTIGISGLYAGIWATFTFQIVESSYKFLWLGAVAAVSSLVAGWWWREYGIEKNKQFFLWLGAWFLINYELFWALTALPIGYLAGGLTMGWIWYVLWLLARFYLSKEGLNWQKQRVFVIINIFLLLLFLIFIVRWK
ncbi:MAG: hypothetical protein PHY40_01690 [Patescibacteria group bacterium]|nr:hypothetical protein [Patescibacteria group bacterium]